MVHGLQSTSIHVLEDDSLLNVFYLYRSAIFGDAVVGGRNIGKREWDRERWWYKLTQVCRRWRNVILESASFLDLRLVCTYGTPIADMLAHSPPLPLVIDYPEVDWDITAEDEAGIILALEKRDRVRRIRFAMPVWNMQKFIMAIDSDQEYSKLESLIMEPSTEDSDNNTVLKLPELFQAPNIRHLLLRGFDIPIRSRLLTNAVGIVTLCLYMDHPVPYLRPDTLHQWISSMPQLETLLINFSFPVPNRNMDGQLTHMPHVRLPKLRRLEFQGISAYMEAVAWRITTPRLEKLDIQFFSQRTFSVPRLLRFVKTTESLRFDCAEVRFSGEEVYVGFYLRKANIDALSICVDSSHHGWQVSSVAQIFNSPRQIIFPTVEHLTLECVSHRSTSEEHNEVDRIEWRQLLRPFSSVKAVYIDGGLVEELSHSLRMDDGEDPLKLLPELQRVSYPGSLDTYNRITSFINARKNAGRPVTFDVRTRCPYCRREFIHPRGLRQHLILNLPHHIQCPFPHCSWTGSRRDTLEQHMENVHPDFNPSQKIELGETQIYDPKMFTQWMADRTMTIEAAVNFSLSMIQQRFADLGKTGVETNVWGRKKKFCNGVSLGRP